MEEIRLLQKEDVEVRVAQTTIYEGTVKASLLIYKNARVDMKIMDELYTPMGWKRTHRLIGDRLYCCVEVWNPDTKQWVAKEDVGTESNTEAEKGQASDSFKRACFNWGIGRELYTAPKISVVLNEKEYSRDTNGKIKVWASFDVSEIGYDAKTRTITTLTIVDRFGNVRFTMGPQQSQEKPSRASKTPKKPVTPQQPSEGTSKLYPGGEMYLKIVAAHALGKRTKDGGDYRTAWATATNAGEEMLAAFDHDVAAYKMNNHITQ